MEAERAIAGAHEDAIERVGLAGATVGDRGA
jgi:hypothetical protein